MKFLRIFVDNDLEKPVQWLMIDQGSVLEEGFSTFEEIANFNLNLVEIYLSPELCSIFKLDTAGISAWNLNDELILGLIEDDLTDDITEVKPLVMKADDKVIFVAIFNAEYFKKLLDKIYILNKPIRFIQSFAYATLFEEGAWTIVLNKQTSFIRTTKYQYYLLDDTGAFPETAIDMLRDEKPTHLNIYNLDERDLGAVIPNLPVPTKIIKDKYEYEQVVWNFYNQKNSDFDFKIEPKVKSRLFQLLHTAKYFFAVLLVFWLIKVTILEFNNLSIESNLHQVLHVSGNQTNHIKLNNLRQNIAKNQHLKALYADDDAVILLSKFLTIVSSVDENTITAVIYQDHQLKVFVNGNFSTDEFNDYQHIFLINHIEASINDYKDYVKATKDSVNNNSDATLNNNLKISDDTKWVITLTVALQEDYK